MAETLAPYEVERGEESSELCACCGRESRRVTGFVYRGDATVAAYIVNWTVGHVDERGADIDLILGRWGEGAEAEDRFAVCLVHHVHPEEGPSVTVIDAPDRLDIARHSLVGTALRRDQVIGTPLAPQVFEIIDAIYLQDGRLF